MKTLAQKMLRGRVEQDIIKGLKKKYPHFEIEQSMRKVPINPKIVVYSNVASVDKFLEEYQWPYLEYSQPT